MQKTFVEYGAQLPPAEHPFTDALQITLEYYEDGYDVTILDNYEGGPRFEIDADRSKDVAVFLQGLVENGYVYVGYQVMRVRAFTIRSMSPRNRYTTVIEAPEMENTDGPGQRGAGEGDEVREGDQELLLDPSEPQDSEPSGVGI